MCATQAARVVEPWWREFSPRLRGPLRLDCVSTAAVPATGVRCRSLSADSEALAAGEARDSNEDVPVGCSVGA